jgi:O-antigen/teichoic acid export membrane protein
MYGSQWDQSVDLARLLAAAMLFSVPASLCSAALLSSGGVTTIARVTVYSAMQIVVFAAIGVSQGLLALGIAMIASSLVNAALWLRATSRHIDLQLMVLLLSLRQSMLVALSAAIGPALAFWCYGPYPESFVTPLVMGGTLGLAGFVCGVMLFKHPLREEIVNIWNKFSQSPG